jgi:hypothetical protein
LCQSILDVGGKSDILERIKTRDAELWSLDVAKGVYFINSVDRGLHRGIGRCHVILDGRAERVERIGEEGVYLVETSR